MNVKNGRMKMTTDKTRMTTKIYRKLFSIPLRLLRGMNRRLMTTDSRLSRGKVKARGNASHNNISSSVISNPPQPMLRFTRDFINIYILVLNTYKSTLSVHK